jgi:hypothetical protein
VTHEVHVLCCGGPCLHCIQRIVEINVKCFIINFTIKMLNRNRPVLRTGKSQRINENIQIQCNILMLSGKLTVPDAGTGVLFSCRPLVLIDKMVEVLGLLSQ